MAPDGGLSPDGGRALRPRSGGRRGGVPLGANVPRRRPAADASSLISHPRTLTPVIPTCTVAVGAKQKQESCLSASLRSDSPTRPAGLRGEIKGEASAARRMPEDIRPEGMPAAPGPAECAESGQQTLNTSIQQTTRGG